MNTRKLSPIGQPIRVLCLGAHSDDIEIGCGGTVLKLIKDSQDVFFHWIVFSANDERKKEAHASAEALLREARGRELDIKNFKDGFFPYVGGEIKTVFEELKQNLNPDLIFTHCRSDLHQDHRLVAELTWNTFRDHLILEYEIPKYDGDLGTPNVFVHLEETVCRRKIEHILSFFQTQAQNQWFTKDTFQAIMRLRGVESNSPTQLAEAFYGRKLVLS